MAHYARVQNGIVVDVHVLNNAVITDPDGHEVEALGQEFLANLWGYDSLDYVQCSYNATMRGCYPGVGYSWDGAVFAPPIIVEPAPAATGAP
jgi:hypothetical protein